MPPQPADIVRDFAISRCIDLAALHTRILDLLAFPVSVGEPQRHGERYQAGVDEQVEQAVHRMRWRLWLEQREFCG